MHTQADLERELVRLARAAREAGRVTAGTVSAGLDETGYALVLLAERLDRPAHACELADTLGLDKSTVSRQLTSLVARGLVERTADPADRRAQLVSLTSEGRERLEAARASRRADLGRILDHWTPTELDQTVHALSRLSDGLEVHSRPAARSIPQQTQEPLPA